MTFAVAFTYYDDLRDLSHFSMKCLKKLEKFDAQMNGCVLYFPKFLIKGEISLIYTYEKATFSENILYVLSAKNYNY